MPSFRFSALDSEGKLKRGTIEAKSDVDAGEKLKKHGLSVDELVEMRREESNQLQGTQPRTDDGLRRKLPLIISGWRLRFPRSRL